MSAHTSALSPLVNSFQLTEADKKINIQAIDLPGPGGAYHVYAVTGLDFHPSTAFVPAAVTYIAFQQGPVENDEPNGLTVEALLAICKHRLDCFQAGPYPSTYNERALVYIEQAMAALQERTRARIGAGVEGKLQADPAVSDELTDDDIAYMDDVVANDAVCSVVDVLSAMDLTFPLGLSDSFSRNAILSNVAAQFDLTEDQFPAEFLVQFDKTKYESIADLAKAMGPMIVSIER